MWEFLLGQASILLIAALTLWLKSLDPMRNEIFKEKLAIYKRMLQASFRAVASAALKDGDNKDDYDQGISDCFGELMENMFLVSENVSSAVASIWTLPYEKARADFGNTLAGHKVLVSAIKEDLQLPKIHRVTRFLTGASESPERFIDSLDKDQLRFLTRRPDFEKKEEHPKTAESRSGA